MAVGTVVLGALKAVGSWVLSNPNIAFGAVDKVAQIQADKQALDNEERFEAIDEKLNQLGAATLELDQKIDTEIETLRKQLRTLKILVLTMGITLFVGVIVALVLAIL